VPKHEVRPFFPATAGFKSGSDTPSAFLARCLKAVEQFEPGIGAFVHLDTSAAVAAAQRSTERWRSGKPLSRIDGMPIGVKDIIETVDMPTQMGSPIYQNWRSGRDAASVAALRAAGAVILGKTVTTEFAATVPRGTRNPLDARRTPGGSSSGSAAAVASGMVSAALGTQVIGSILRPSSFCGCVGFKPTIGAINRGGSHDGLSQSAHGPIAASLEDAWIVAREIADRVGGDPGSPACTARRRSPPPACRRGSRCSRPRAGRLPSRPQKPHSKPGWRASRRRVWR
jgi:Asp-tRNA(Asn)/Glu-tRNA(Gln) amidotransferase A subunit family amidase